MGQEMTTNDDGDQASRRISAQVSVTDAFAATVRSYLSINFVQAAALFCRKTLEVERNRDQYTFEELHIAHSSYAIGTIFHCAAFLEAAINELFSDAFQDGYYHLTLELGCREDLVPILQNLWVARRPKMPKTERLSIATKYQMVLEEYGRQMFSNEASYEAVLLLIQARHALMHYKLESVTTISEIPAVPLTVQEFETQLAGRFSLNPLTGDGNPFFPDRCLGHGMCEWAVENAIAFVDEFFNRLGGKPHYYHVRHNLLTR